MTAIGPWLDGRPGWTRYGAASAMVLLVVFGRYAARGLMGGQAPLLPPILAVVAAAYLGGLRPALFATFLSALLSTALFADWTTTTVIGQWAAHVVLFLCIGVLVSWIAHEVQITHAELQVSAQRLAEREHLIRENEERIRENERRILRAEAEVREADRRKDQFLAALAHELRNPLAPIRYAVKLLNPDSSNITHARAREMIERQANQMARLLDDLLDVSRITRNLIELRREVLDLRDIVEQAIAAARPVIDGMHHELQLTVAGEPLRVDGDPTRLRQILDNLLHNAAKYTDPGGRILVSAGREGERIVLCVRDTGIGLPAGSTSRIFELFTQLPLEVRGEGRGRGGLGIGLAVVKHLAELHGGSISADSPGPGKGSVFRLELPVGGTLPREVVRDLPQNVIPLFKNELRVLLVDDHPDIIESLSLLLRGRGYSVHVAEDGVGATRIAEVLQPDLVVLDLGLPNLDGYEVARWIRQQPWGVRARIIAVTGWGQPEDRLRTQEAGFDAHLVKPVDADQLLAVMAQMSHHLSEAPAGRS